MRVWTILCTALLIVLLVVLWGVLLLLRSVRNEAILARRDARQQKARADALQSTVEQLRRELQACEAKRVQAQRVVDYVCEANRRFAK